MSPVASGYGTAVLRIHDFRRLMLARFFWTFGAQMQGVVVSWQIYRLTHDPLSLGLIGLAEALTFTAFALWAGHIADRSEKRFIILCAQGLLLLGAAALWGLTGAGNRRTLPIYAVIALTGLARSFLWSSSVSFAEQTVPKAVYSSAAAWNSSTWEIASILGPAAGGLLYGLRGPETAYAAAGLFILTGLLFAARLNRRPAVRRAETESLRESLSQGIRFVFAHQVILAALALDMFAVLFGGAVAILPVFAESLNVGPAGLGLLRAAPSLGAIAMAVYQAHRPPFRHTGRTLLTAVALFGIFIIAFAFSQSFLLSFFLLAASGMADNISVIIRASILQAATPDHMRGRVSAVNGIFIGSSNELGAFESGVAARLMGAVPSVVFGGVMTLATVAFTFWRAPRLRRLESIQKMVIAADGLNPDASA